MSFFLAHALRIIRETSNKAMNAINQISLVPFLMSFLASRDQLPLSTVTSAGQRFFMYSWPMSPLTSDMQHNVCMCSLMRTHLLLRKSVRMRLTLLASFPSSSRRRGFLKLMGRTRRLKTTVALRCRYYAVVGRVWTLLTVT